MKKWYSIIIIIILFLILGEDEDVYSSHILKDMDGKVLCPVNWPWFLQRDSQLC